MKQINEVETNLEIDDFEKYLESFKMLNEFKICNYDIQFDENKKIQQINKFAFSFINT